MTHLRLAVLVVVGLQTLSLSACRRSEIKIPRPDAGADADPGNAWDGATGDDSQDVLDAPPADPPVAAVLAVEPASAVLGAVVVGPYVTPDDPAVLSVKNSGGAATGTLQVGLAGPNASDFRMDADACSGLALPAQGSCAMTVVYVPPAHTVFGGEAALVATDTASGQSVTAVLHGQIFLGDCVLLTGGRDLGLAAPGAVGPEVLFTVSNACTAFEVKAISVSVTPSTDIRVSTDTCTNQPIAPLGTCTVGLRLAPPQDAAPRTVAAVLTVSADVGSVSLAVTGNVGGTPALIPTPTSINFGAIPVDQASTPRTLLITSSGPVAKGPLTIAFSGAGLEQLTLLATTCNGGLSPGASCQISVQYLPADTAGVAAVMTVTDGTSTVVVPITGSGVSVVQDASVDTNRGVDGQASPG